MIKLEQLKLPVGHTDAELLNAAASALRCAPSDILTADVRKRSLDARKKPNLFYVYTLVLSLKNEQKALKKCKHASAFSENAYTFPSIPAGARSEHAPVIVGSGPAGLFCTLLLAKAGLRPVLIERGEAVEDRQKTVQAFWEGSRDLDPGSNVQFGEGGAGTFSDGKLNTMTHDPLGRGRFVLEEFVRFGASPEILYDQKPHVGTDKLIGIVKGIREEILSLGGQVRFGSCLTDIFLQNDQIVGIEVNGSERIDTETVVIAVGHSARDTYKMLEARGLSMRPKAFAVGVRVQHPQEMIDLSQYGRTRGTDLPPASYKLTYHASSGRGVYTFCMCPGGYVVNASSRPGRLAVNGMSYSGRSGANANSAVIVTVSPEDFAPYEAVASKPVFAGVAFQEALEKAAFERADGAIPLQRFGDFLSERPSEEDPDSVLQPACKGAFAWNSLNGIFTPSVEASLKEGITEFGRKIYGFDRPDTILAGVESRTSSPVRMERDESMQSNLSGLYPCGEGAGYAGGIMSAAVDGIKVAEKILERIPR